MDAKYMKLIERHPLLPITTKARHRAAKKMIVELSERDGSLSTSEVGYGKILVRLIQEYEREAVENFFKDVTGEEALQYLLNEHNIKQADVAEIAGISKQNLNDFLKGRRGLTKRARLKLADYFRVSADVFELSEEQLESA
jgi:antitoxin component HigA of HigAB toxin-antitoxin module